MKSNFTTRGMIFSSLLFISLATRIPDCFAEKHHVLESQQQRDTVSKGQTTPDEMRVVTGQVVDEKNQSIPGATVINLETKAGVITDQNGMFTIKLSTKNSRLKISFIGYIPVEIPISQAKSFYPVSLKIDAKQMNEVIVTGYQSLSRERATGAFNNIKSKQIEKPATSIAQRLIGTTAGLQTTVAADGSVNLQLRGLTSLKTSSAPLIVVDGFPIVGGINTINPNEVESITVLKDAAAASIWGARSANGVIVITLKSGASNKKQKTKIDFNSFIRVSPKLDYDYAYPNVSSSEMVDYALRTYKELPSTVDDNSNLSTLSSIYPLAYIALNERKLNNITEDELQATLMRLRNTDNREQIKDLMLSNPFSQQYSLNFSNTTDKLTTFVSLMYQNSNSIAKGDKNDRYSLSVRTNATPFKWLGISFNGNFNQSNSQENGFIYTGMPYNSFFNEDGSRANLPEKIYTPFAKRVLSKSNFPYSDWSYNPLTDMEGHDRSTINTNSRAQIGINIKPIKEISFESKFQYENVASETKELWDETTSTVRYEVNTTSKWTRATNTAVPNLPMGSFLNSNNSSNVIMNWRNQLNFNKEIAENHSFNFIIGSEIQSRINKSRTNPRTYGYNDDKLTVANLPNGFGGSGVLDIRNWNNSSISFSYTPKFTYSTDRYFSAYTNLAYSFKDKYTLSASARTDASNFITEDPILRYSPFWSTGLSWNATKEKFISKIKWIDRLQVRMTYGFNGNVDRSTSTQPLISVNTNQNATLNDFTASVSSYGNPDLTWEKTSNLNFGVDYSLFKGKVFGELNLYNKKGTNLIASITLPGASGTSSQDVNAAQMINRGIEFEIGSALNITEKISWIGNFNIAYNFNEITKLTKLYYSASSLQSGGSSAYLQGYNANTLWSYQYKGVANIGTDIAPNIQPVVQGTGNALYPISSSTPGDGRDYMLPMGTKNAPLNLGFTNTFRIDNFEVSLIVTGKFGHVFNGFQYNYPTFGLGAPNKLYSETLNSDPSEVVPIPSSYNSLYNNWRLILPALDYRVQNASHIRLQEANITYNISNKLISKLHCSSARIFAQGNNLLLIGFNKYNEDPEFPLGTMRPQPSFSFGINISL